MFDEFCLIRTTRYLGEKTVKVHRARVMEKVRAGSLAELVRLADEAGVTVPKTSFFPTAPHPRYPVPATCRLGVGPMADAEELGKYEAVRAVVGSYRSQ